MKKRIALILVLTLCVILICACGPTQETEETVSIEKYAGAWTIAEDGEANMPEEARAAFDKAMEGMTGVGYTPLAYLGSQVVAGMNYAYLCKAATVTETTETKLCVVTVYNDLDGNASVQNTRDIVISAYTADSEISFIPADVTGGWGVNTGYANTLPTDAQTAFDDAMADMAGVGYAPIALLGTQVVAGCNRAFLCSATSVTAEPGTALCIVVVYTDLEGSSAVTSIAGFDF